MTGYLPVPVMRSQTIHSLRPGRRWPGLLPAWTCRGGVPAHHSPSFLEPTQRDWTCQRGPRVLWAAQGGSTPAWVALSLCASYTTSSEAHQGGCLGHQESPRTGQPLTSPATATAKSIIPQAVCHSSPGKNRRETQLCCGHKQDTEPRALQPLMGREKLLLWSRALLSRQDILSSSAWEWGRLRPPLRADRTTPPPGLQAAVYSR